MNANQRLLSAVLAGVTVLSACGSKDPTRVGRPPVVSSYAPGDRRLAPSVGDTLRFSLAAFDPDSDPLTTAFFVDGIRASASEHWGYAIEDTGLVTVRGSVSDGEHESFIEWTVSRRKPVNLPPSIDAVLPIETNPVIVVGTELQFAIHATDPESKPLAYTFTVNDSVLATNPQVEFVPTSVGTKQVRAVVTDGENFAVRDWSLKVTTVPDAIPPATITITNIATGFDPGEIDLEWIAVGRDDMTGRASEYQVRTSPEPIVTEADWERASKRPGVPPPALPGEIMGMTVEGLQPARLTYVTVRALDDFGNRSPIGASPRVATRGLRVTGRVVDPLTGTALAGVTVAIGVRESLTDATGAFELLELEPVIVPLVVREDSGPEIGPFFNSVSTYTVRHADVLAMGLLPAYDLSSTFYVDFLQFFRIMTDIPGNPFGTQQRHWKLPIDLYVRPFSNGGLDYRAVVERVAGEFDALLGTRVFNLVSTRPQEGVETAYSPGLTQDNYSVTEWTSDWYPRLALIQFRTVYTAPTEFVLARTARHELGHALGLAHSVDPAHLMIGGSQAPTVDNFTSDELAVLQCMYGLVRGSDTRQFQRD